MSTRRNKYTKRNRTKRQRAGKISKTGKKWVTAIDAANKTLKTTGSIKAARSSLKKQALNNARKLFGSVGNL
jgi:hypothetical protein